MAIRLHANSRDLSMRGETVSQDPNIPPSQPSATKPPKRERHNGPRRFSMERDGRGLGSPLFACGNCVHFSGGESTTGTCSKAQPGSATELVEATARPCPARHRHGFGAFEPVDYGDLAPEVDLSCFAADDLVILRWRARDAEVRGRERMAADLAVGDCVLDRRDGRNGIAVAVGPRRIRIANDGVIWSCPTDQTAIVATGDDG